MLLGTSLLADGEFTSAITYRKETNYRQVRSAQRVDVYRNLNKNDCFSIRPREGEYKAKVSGYAPCVIVKDVKLVCSVSGQQRVKAKGQKDVHAYIRATFVDAYDTTNQLFDVKGSVRVCYNPFISPLFFTCERDDKGALIEDSIKYIDSPPEGYPFAVISGKDVVFLKHAA
jgi:hypothetical protein